MSGIHRRQIQISGIVQGVGFRPFVYKLAHQLTLHGYVLNSSAGVTIEVEGADADLECFVRRLRDESPPLAQIEDVAITTLGAGRLFQFSSFATATHATWKAGAGFAGRFHLR